MARNKTYVISLTDEELKKLKSVIRNKIQLEPLSADVRY